MLQLLQRLADHIQRTSSSTQALLCCPDCRITDRLHARMYSQDRPPAFCHNTFAAAAAALRAASAAALAAALAASLTLFAAAAAARLAALIFAAV